MPSLRYAAALATAVLVGCSAPPLAPTTVSPTTSPSSATGGSSEPSPVAGEPVLDVEIVTDQLEHGWDVGFLPDGQVLVTERPGRLSLLSTGRAGAVLSRVEADLSGVYAQGEGGLLGLVMHPDFATSREFTTCLNYQEAGAPVDIRLVTWRLSEDGARATFVKNLLTGLPRAESGRHSGCRPALAEDGALLVGTGDTADGRIPQDRGSLGGKVIRLDLKTGQPLPDNPFASSSDERERYVLTYGHRNIQGVAVQPGTGAVFTAEHGPSTDDEVNRVVPGGNYGWDPAQGGTVSGYDESVPMTDLTRYPDAVPAVWSTGSPTQALCGAAFLSGAQWGPWDGALAVTALKGEKLVVLQLDSRGGLASTAIPEELAGAFGRLRGARLGPDGSLYVTTSNGTGDELLRITPQP